MKITYREALSIAQKLKNGEAVEPIIVGGVTYYPRKAVKYVSGLTSAISNSDLVVSSADKEVGVRNIQSNKLDFPFLATGARMLFDTTTGATVTPQTAAWGDDAPVEMANGELKIISGGKELSELPISVIANNYAATSNKDDFYDLGAFLIRPNQAFEVKAISAGAATANKAYRFEIAGVEFIKG